MLTEEIDIWRIVQGKVIVPTDPHQKNVAKSKRFFLDSMKDPLIPHIARKSAKEILEAWTNLYKSVNISRRKLLNNKLTQTYMSNSNTVASYLMKITKLKYQLL
jgi:hypothetical protein